MVLTIEGEASRFSSIVIHGFGEVRVSTESHLPRPAGRMTAIPWTDHSFNRTPQETGASRQGELSPLPSHVGDQSVIEARVIRVVFAGAKFNRGSRVQVQLARDVERNQRAPFDGFA